MKDAVKKIGAGRAFLVLGPFGDIKDTEQSLGWKVAAGYKGLEIPHLSEFDRVARDLPDLPRNFKPDTTARYDVQFEQPGVWQREDAAGNRLSFEDTCGSPQPWWMAAYAYTEIRCRKKTNAVMNIGSDHSIAAWLNDKLVFQHRGQRLAESGQNKAQVVLHEGENRLWIKAIQRGNSRVLMDFLDSEGAPLSGLEFRVPKVSAGMPVRAPKWARPLSADLRCVRDCILNSLYARNVEEEEVRMLVATLSPKGTWPDINYEDESSARWEPGRHAGRLAQLALAYKAPWSPFKDDRAVAESVAAGLSNWLEHDYKCPNWWHNEIAVPGAMADVFLLLEDELTDERKNGIVGILKRAPIKMTAQNLVWLAQNNIKRAVIERDPKGIKSALAFVLGEIRMSDGEGLKHDRSFHQHGACVYNHGYGADYIKDCARLAAMFAGTKFAFPENKTALLAQYLLEGSQWMARGPTCDPGPRGRQIAWPDLDLNAEYLADAASTLLQVKTGREDELRGLIARVKGSAGAQPLTGNRHFRQSDFMVHHRPSFYASARAYSTRTLNTDFPACSDGLLNHYVADGCNWLMQNGNEYRKIFPAWDWRKVPGTTVEQIPAPPSKDHPVQRRGTTEFVGGVSDGTYGMAACDFRRETLRARKAWFFFDDEYVCLGAGISCDSDHRVATTVDQRHLAGEVRVAAGDETRILPRGTHRLATPFDAYHDGVAYSFIRGGEMVLKNDSQSGSWHDINYALSGETVTHDMFLPWIDHGVRPKQACYAYMVAPGSALEGAMGSARRCPVRIIANSPGLQAVRHATNGIVAAAFYEPGSPALPGVEPIHVNKPCLLMLRRLDAEYMQLSVSDPTQKLGSLTVGIGARLSGDGCSWDTERRCSVIYMQLPEGGAAGGSAVKTFRRIR